MYRWPSGIYKKIKMYSASLVIRELELKITMRYYLTPVEWLLSETHTHTQATNVGDDVQKR